MNEPHHLENLIFFQTVASVELSRKTFVFGILIFSQFKPVYMPKNL